MSSEERNIKEIKLTAAVYATQKDWLQHVKDTGRLPENPKPRPWLGGVANNIIRNRGRDITLSPDEQLVFDAILRERRLPGGGVILIPESDEYSECSVGEHIRKINHFSDNLSGLSGSYKTISETSNT